MQMGIFKLEVKMCLYEKSEEEGKPINCWIYFIDEESFQLNKIQSDSEIKKV